MALSWLPFLMSKGNFVLTSFCVRSLITSSNRMVRVPGRIDCWHATNDDGRNWGSARMLATVVEIGQPLIEVKFVASERAVPLEKFQDVADVYVTSVPGGARKIFDTEGIG